MTLTWAEDRVTLASDPSAVPGAKTEGAARCRLCWFGIGTKALNAPCRLAVTQPPVNPVDPSHCGSPLPPPHCPPPRCVAQGCTRLFELRHLLLPPTGGGRNLPRRPMYLNTPRRPFVRTSSPEPFRTPGDLACCAMLATSHLTCISSHGSCTQPASRQASIRTMLGLVRWVSLRKCS